MKNFSALAISIPNKTANKTPLYKDLISHKMGGKEFISGAALRGMMRYMI